MIILTQKELEALLMESKAQALEGLIEGFGRHLTPEVVEAISSIVVGARNWADEQRGEKK